jgi:thymidylate synthase
MLIALRFCVREYHELLRLVLDHGQARIDRTGVGTISVFGAQARNYRTLQGLG